MKVGHFAPSTAKAFLSTSKTITLAKPQKLAKCFSVHGCETNVPEGA
jgi:hypothetical protein